jgi:hypothetical protein
VNGPWFEQEISADGQSGEDEKQRPEDIKAGEKRAPRDTNSNSDSYSNSNSDRNSNSNSDRNSNLYADSYSDRDTDAVSCLGYFNSGSDYWRHFANR